MPKRKCNFTNDLRKKYSCFRPGRDTWEAECTVCKAGTYVSVANKGAKDLQAHIATTKHKTAVQGESSSAKLTEYLVRPGKGEDIVNAAEGVLAFHTVKHHNSYRSMDCTSALLKKAFPDSDTAEKFSSARTKTEAIVNSVIAPHSIDVSLEALKEIKYCGIATDGSNHGAVKIFPIIIQYFDWKKGGVQSTLLEVKDTPNETADTIASYLIETLRKNDLSEKCIAFTGDNCNTNFGGIGDEGGKNVYANFKKLLQNKTLISVGCPAHIMNNCVHHGADTLNIDIENIMFKIYQYFHIYTVRTETLKEYCDFVDVEYRKLLSHSKTRWLSLFPGIERLLQMFPALKGYFLSQDKTPVMIKRFFENEFSDIYLWHMHSLMCVFHSPIKEMEKENNSIVEVRNILQRVHAKLEERQRNNFMSLKVKGLLAQKRTDGHGKECERFYADVRGLYSACLQYLQKWMTPMEEFTPLMWMDLSQTPSWTDVEACIKYLGEKGVPIDDAKCFDQVTDLKKFTESSNGDGKFNGLQVHQKWCKYFEKAKSLACYSELLKIAQFAFALPCHNANVERVFSLMQSQRTKEKSRLSVESLKGLLFVQYNFKETSCKDFHAYLMSNRKLLGEISSSAKYAWANKEGQGDEEKDQGDEEENQGDKEGQDD